MHSGPVDDQCAAPSSAGQLRPPRSGGGASASEPLETTPRSARRHDPPRGSSRPPASYPRATAAKRVSPPMGSEGASSTTGATSRSTPSSTVPRSPTSTPESPTWIHSEVTPFSRSVSAASCEAFASGSASSARTSQPSPRAGGRTGSGRSATRAGVPNGLMPMPSSVRRVSVAQTAVVGVVLGEAAGLAQHGGRRLLPLGDVVLLPLGQGQVRVGAHARRIGTGVGARPATVKYPT